MTTIKIQSVKEFPTKDGRPRLMLETSSGSMACWDEKLFDILPLWIDKFVEVETSTSADGRYTNLVGIIGAGVSRVTPLPKSAYSSPAPTPYDNKGARVGNAVKLAVDMVLHRTAPSGELPMGDVEAYAVQLLRIMKKLESE